MRSPPRAPSRLGRDRGAQVHAPRVSLSFADVHFYPDFERCGAPGSYMELEIANHKTARASVDSPWPAKRVWASPGDLCCIPWCKALVRSLPPVLPLHHRSTPFFRTPQGSGLTGSRVQRFIRERRMALLFQLSLSLLGLNCGKRTWS